MNEQNHIYSSTLERGLTTVSINDDRVRESFAWLSQVWPKATGGSELSDWHVSAYKDALVFRLVSGESDEAFMIRAKSVVCFGEEHFSLEEAYAQLEASVSRRVEPAVHPRARRVRLS